MDGGTVFHFIDGSPREVLDRAREAANGLDVRIGGGPTIVRDFVAEDLIDTMHIVQVPIVLGRGVDSGKVSRGWNSATTSRRSAHPPGSPTSPSHGLHDRASQTVAPDPIDPSAMKEQ
jgi:dihydrofolate reductase